MADRCPDTARSNPGNGHSDRERGRSNRGRRPRAPDPRGAVPRAAGKAMNPIVAIALLTLREAVRRRLIAACAAITIGLVALSAWGFDRLSHNASITSGEVNTAIPQALILFMFMFSFVVALSASAMASPAISTGVVAIALFGAGWLAGVIGSLGTAFKISSL